MTLDELEERGFKIHINWAQGLLILRYHTNGGQTSDFLDAIRWRVPMSYEAARRRLIAHFVKETLT